jgi:cytochrome c peroxidase
MDKIKILFFLTLLIPAVLIALSARSVTNPVEGSSGNYTINIADSTAFEELGEALFSDIRFSSPEGKLSGSKKDQFSRFQVSCKSCHLVDEQLKEKGMRGYTDFQKRTPVPFRAGDKEPYQFTHRRTQQMINIAGDNISASPVYHWDGEFNAGNEHVSLIKLIEKTFTSRNMGWRSGEAVTANTLRLRFILESEGIIAGGEGEGEEKKLSYIEQYCNSLGMTKQQFFSLSGEEILYIANEAIAFYIENIRSDTESPFDLFLIENGIADPLKSGETVLNDLLLRNDLKFIDKTIPVLNSEVTTSRKVKFGSRELKGLKLFMNKEKTNCSSCHTPPAFTNNKFYNIGVSEYDYKDVHRKMPGNFYTGEEIQKNILVKDINELKNSYQVYPNRENPMAIDLGHGLFEKTKTNFGAFRTPSLRNLKYCDPYLHSGRAETIYSAITHHIKASQNKYQLEFLSAELIQLNLSRVDIDALTAFVNSLNDHYE